ncbi:hypothetical protein EDC01DRAFT_633528 [Geopyxis carbonaria]|nr:hypothetical protein EDC01DRAFT_633528 [Geopyxis carbonaria]
MTPDEAYALQSQLQLLSVNSPAVPSSQLPQQAVIHDLRELSNIRVTPPPVEGLGNLQLPTPATTPPDIPAAPTPPALRTLLVDEKATDRNIRSRRPKGVQRRAGPESSDHLAKNIRDLRRAGRVWNGSEEEISGLPYVQGKSNYHLKKLVEDPHYYLYLKWAQDTADGGEWSMIDGLCWPKNCETGADYYRLLIVQGFFQGQGHGGVRSNPTPERNPQRNLRRSNQSESIDGRGPLEKIGQSSRDPAARHSINHTLYRGYRGTLNMHQRHSRSFSSDFKPPVSQKPLRNPGHKRSVSAVENWNVYDDDKENQDPRVVGGRIISFVL